MGLPWAVIIAIRRCDRDSHRQLVMQANKWQAPRGTTGRQADRGKTLTRVPIGVSPAHSSTSATPSAPIAPPPATQHAVCQVARLPALFLHNLRGPITDRGRLVSFNRQRQGGCSRATHQAGDCLPSTNQGLLIRCQPGY